VQIIGSFAFALLVMIPLWRILQRAGLQPALALIALVPYIGIVVVATLLAFARWSGVRAGDGFGPYQPDLFDRGPR
jgi:tetrahydromethanopterin S-methyltransferase subunit E